VKNTAIGSHAGPAGSITTARLVPAGHPASAAASTAARLSTAGHALVLGHDMALAIAHPHRGRGGNPTADAGQPPVIPPASPA